MQIKKFALLPLFILLFIITSAMTAYILFQGSRVSIVNDSKSYNLSITDEKGFDKFLEEEGMWKTNNVSSNGKLSFFTANKIKIIISEKNEGKYSQVNAKEQVITNINITREKQTLIVAIYINPILKQKDQEYLTSEVFYQILFAVNLSVGKDRKTLDQTLSSSINDLKLFESKIPIKITKQI